MRLEFDNLGEERREGLQWYLVPSRNRVGYAWIALTIDDIEKSD